jgi:hypothetical protein
MPTLAVGMFSRAAHTHTSMGMEPPHHGLPDLPLSLMGQEFKIMGLP